MLKEQRRLEYEQLEDAFVRDWTAVWRAYENPDNMGLVEYLENLKQLRLEEKRQHEMQARMMGIR